MILKDMIFEGRSILKVKKNFICAIVASDMQYWEVGTWTMAESMRTLYASNFFAVDMTFMSVSFIKRKSNTAMRE